MRPPTIVMLNKLGEYALQMPRAHDQEPIQALRSSGADEPFCDPIRLGCLNRRPNNSDVFGVKDGIEAARELGIVIAGSENEPASAVP